MKVFTHLLALLIACSSGLAAEAQNGHSCDLEVRDQAVRPNDVIMFVGKTLATVPDAAEARIGSVRLGYIIAPRQYISGALIVKTRHRIAPNASVAPGRVRITREAYTSPCVGRSAARYTDNYSHEVDIHGYVDFHRYQFGDSNRDVVRNLESFHADIGPRPQRDCANTSDREIRAHFLFEQELSQRQIAGVWAKLGRQTDKLKENFGVDSALASPADFNEFTAYRTIVIPYRKEAGKAACIKFSIAHVPNTVSTEVMIVDADDALSPLIFSDPQQTRNINWR